MIKQDYFERLVQDIAKVLAKLIFNKDWKETLPLLEQAYISYLPFDRAEANSQPIANFMSWLLIEKKCQLPQIEALAELFFFEARQTHDQPDKEDYKMLLAKLLLLLEYAQQHSEVYSMEREDRINWIRQQLK